MLSRHRAKREHKGGSFFRRVFRSKSSHSSSAVPQDGATLSHNQDQHPPEFQRRWLLRRKYKKLATTKIHVLPKEAEPFTLPERTKTFQTQFETDPHSHEITPRESPRIDQSTELQTSLAQKRYGYQFTPSLVDEAHDGLGGLNGPLPYPDDDLQPTGTAKPHRLSIPMPPVATSLGYGFNQHDTSQWTPGSPPVDDDQPTQPLSTVSVGLKMKSRPMSIISNPMDMIPQSPVAQRNAMRFSIIDENPVRQESGSVTSSSVSATSSQHPTEGSGRHRHGMGSAESIGSDDFSNFDKEYDEDDVSELESEASDEQHPPVDEEPLLYNYNQWFASLEPPPPWYIKQPECLPRGSPRFQCGTCQHINISYLYGQKESGELPHPDEYIRLGSIGDFIAKFRDCSLCAFFLRLIALEVATEKYGLGFTTDQMASEFFGSYLKDNGNLTVDYSLYPNKFKEYYKIPGLFLCRGPPPEPNLENGAEPKRPSYLLGFREVHSCCQAPGTGRLVAKLTSLDIEWIIEEMKLCEERSVRRSKFLPVQIQVIDVHQMCIVDREPWEDYVTLSYVWGKSEQIKREYATEPILRRPKGLLVFWDQIPATIQDAILLTRRIGQNFLWVDALCIFQDDKEAQAEQLRHMGTIYQVSVLSIQARCGIDASYGLPGVRPGTRQVRQILGIAGKKLICNILPFPEETATVWDTRAWTMQESVLSQRKLIITDQSCEFWCGHTATAEDVHCRHRYWPVGAPFKSMLFFKNHHSSFIPMGRQDTNFTFYTFLVELYTLREMTVSGDAENALLGIFDSVKHTFNGEFLYGLPDNEIVAALLWIPVGNSERRLDSMSGNPLFPSWSWLGWTGPVGYPWRSERTMPITTWSSPLQWKIIDSDDDSSDVEWYENARRGFNSSWTRLESDPWCWTDGTTEGRLFEHPLCRDSLDRNMLQQEPHKHRLNIRTLFATLCISGRVVERPKKYGDDQIHEMHILDDQGFAVGAIAVPDQNTFTHSQEHSFRKGSLRGTFIVLSRASIQDDPVVGLDDLEDWSTFATADIGTLSNISDMRPEDTPFLHPIGMFDKRRYDEDIPYCLFTVLMIEWDRTQQVAYRVAVGRVHISAFMGAQPVMREIALE